MKSLSSTFAGSWRLYVIITHGGHIGFQAVCNEIGLWRHVWLIIWGPKHGSRHPNKVIISSTFAELWRFNDLSHYTLAAILIWLYNAWWPCCILKWERKVIRVYNHVRGILRSWKHGSRHRNDVSIFNICRVMTILQFTSLCMAAIVMFSS